MERHKEAEEEYNKAIELNPKDAEAHNNLGNLLSNYVERHKEAEDEYNKAIELNPEYAKANANLGFLFFTINKYPNAKEQFRKAEKYFREKKRDIDAHSMNGYINWCSGRDMWSKEEFQGDDLKRIVDYYNNASAFLTKSDPEISKSLWITAKFIPLDYEFKKLIESGDFGKISKGIKEIVKKAEEVLKDFEKTKAEQNLIFAKSICLLVVQNTTQLISDICENKEVKKGQIDDLESMVNSAKQIFKNEGFTKAKNTVKSLDKSISVLENLVEEIKKEPDNRNEIIERKKRQYVVAIRPLSLLLDGVMTFEEDENKVKKIKPYTSGEIEIMNRLDEIENRQIEHIGISKRTENKIDELLKKAKSNEETIDYIKESIEKSSSENKETLKRLEKIIKNYEKSHNEHNEKLNSIILILTKLSTSENTEGIKKIADELTKDETVNKITDQITDKEEKSLMKKLFGGFKKQIKNIPESVGKELWSRHVTGRITDLIEKGVENPKVIAGLVTIFLQLGKAAL